MQFPQQAERIDPVVFKDQSVAGLLVRRAYLGGDIILQVLNDSRNMPPHSAERVVKAIIDTVGEPAMASITVESIDSKLLEGGKSVYVKCEGMNTDIIKSIMFPQFYQALGETMQVS
jgi:hypothetical protein